MVFNTSINKNSVLSVLANVLLILMTAWMFYWKANSGGQLEWPDAPVEMASLSIAISEVYHGAKHHVGYESLYLEMHKAKGVSMDERFARALKWSPALDETPTFFLREGIGHGYIEYAELAFRLFGANSAALYFLYALLFSISIILCMYRFHNRLAIIGVLILAVTCMHIILTQFGIGIFALIEHNRIYNLRFLSSLAIIPGLYLCFIVMENAQFSRKTLICAIGQAAILGFVCLIRETAYMVIIAILCCALFSWLRIRKLHRPEQVRSIAYYMAAVILITFAISTYSHQNQNWKYRYVYGTKTVVWHRLFISLGANPKWPLAQIKAQVSCPSTPEGIMPGIVDRNGQCMFQSYLISQGRNSISELIDLIYSKEYETVMRKAFFKVMLDHPVFFAETFFIHKPRYMVNTFKWVLGHFRWSMSKLETAFVMFALLTATLCLIFATSEWVWIISVSLVAMWMSSVVPGLLGWAMPHTFYDAIWLTIVLLLAITLGVGIEFMRILMRHK
jgi:hypothetical protein